MSKTYFTLIHYDYNEPCKGKDQCDRESAGVKSVMNSYICSGKDMVNADDMFSAVHYGNWIKNGYASVIEIDSQKTLLEGDTINISLYHSVIFSPISWLSGYFYAISNCSTTKLPSHSCSPVPGIPGIWLAPRPSPSWCHDTASPFSSLQFYLLLAPGTSLHMFTCLSQILSIIEMVNTE